MSIALEKTLLVVVASGLGRKYAHRSGSTDFRIGCSVASRLGRAERSIGKMVWIRHRIRSFESKSYEQNVCWEV